MALKDMFKKKYTSTVYCNNCNTHSEVQIPKGVTILQFVETGPCPNCNCSTLVADYRQIDEFRDQPKQQVKVNFEDITSSFIDIVISLDRKEMFIKEKKSGCCLPF